MQDVENLHNKQIFLMDSDYVHRISGRFVCKLLKLRNEWFFDFFKVPAIELTNSRAEGSLRCSVIYEKITFYIKGKRKKLKLKPAYGVGHIRLTRYYVRS